MVTAPWTRPPFPTRVCHVNKGGARVRTKRGIATTCILPFTLLLAACATTPFPCSREAVVDRDNQQTVGTACSSYHASITNMFAAIARGDMAAAMHHLSAVTGLSIAQQQTVINGLTHIFDEGNQIPGECGNVAREGFQTLGRIGKHFNARPYFLKIVPTDGDILGFQLRSGVVKQVSNNGVHVAVKFAGRVFDAYTGPGGLAEREYIARLHTFHGQNISTKVYPSFPSMFQGLE